VCVNKLSMQLSIISRFAARSEIIPGQEIVVSW